MKKIKSLFVREFGEKHSVKATPIVEPGFEWVLEGEGIATRKRDGTCTKIENGEIFRRYDCKHGKTPPQGFIPADEPDPITEHWPGWLKIDKYNSKGDEKFFVEAYKNTFGSIDAIPENGTYELCGPKSIPTQRNSTSIYSFAMVQRCWMCHDLSRVFVSIWRHIISKVSYFIETMDQMRCARLSVLILVWNGTEKRLNDKNICMI